MIHRDMKPENVLMASKDSLTVKLTDFGFATYKSPESDKFDLQCGTPQYMAPEIYKVERYNNKVDVWATGVIVYLLVTGTYPFEGKTEGALRNSVLCKNLIFNGKYWKGMSQDCKDFMKLCLAKKPSDRATAE